LAVHDYDEKGLAMKLKVALLSAAISVALAAAFPSAAEADTINGVDVAYQTTWINNGHTYYVLGTASTWAQAEAWAVQLGGHLATINDATEQSFAAGLRGSSGLYARTCG
jgi:hypothetical protein